jgi:hypothetical protein
MVLRPRGKPEFFTRDQNQALRRALLAYLEPLPREQRTQQAVGELLGVVQQTAGRYLTREDAGFSYLAATEVARLSGYKGVDEFFEAHGLMVGAKDAGRTELWPGRTLAIILAKRDGISETAIQAVVVRYQDRYHQNRPPPWWAERFRIEHDDEMSRARADATTQAAEKPREPPSPHDRKAVRKGHRKAG